MKDRSEQNFDSIRLDKWLWAARFYRTRTLAQDNIDLGRVRSQGMRLKASKEVKIGDELEIVRGDEKFIVIVRALSAKRGNFESAQQLYEETPESLRKRELVKENRKMMPMPGQDYHGRPTKRDGRKLREFMSDFNPGKDI